MGTVFLFSLYPWLKLSSELRPNYQNSFKMSIMPLLVKNLYAEKKVFGSIFETLDYNCFKNSLFLSSNSKETGGIVLPHYKGQLSLNYSFCHF